jgi:dipeptidase
VSKRFLRKPTTVLFLLSVVLLLPMAANAGVADIITLLNTITSTLQNSIGQVLSSIQSINTTARNFEQQFVRPVTLINQTKAEVAQVRSQFTSLAGQIQSIPTNSASLVNPKQLETLLRSQQSGNLAQISGSYTQVYQALPQANQTTATQRNLMDVDDALALDALKTTTISDQASQRMLNVADGIEQQAAVSAPGSASILTAQAQAANLQNQALLQRMLAAELRQEAARLAHTNALRKQSAEANRTLRNNLLQILSR